MFDQIRHQHGAIAAYLGTKREGYHAWMASETVGVFGTFHPESLSHPVEERARLGSVLKECLKESH